MFQSTDTEGAGDPEVKDKAANIDWKRQVVTLDLYHQLSAQVGIGGTIPYYEVDVERVDTGTEDDGSGVGDLGIYLSLAPFESNEPHDPDGFFSLHNLTLLAGLTIPTGDELKGDAPSQHFDQLSSGSFDLRLGLTYNGRISDPFRSFFSASMLVDTGSDVSGFRNGNLYDFRLGASYDPWKPISFFADLDFVVRERNLQQRVTQSGASYPISVLELGSSGGTWWFLELGASVSPGAGFFVDLAVSIPIYHNVNGSQPGVDPVWLLGAGYSF